MQDKRQWFKCPKEGCAGTFWRPHPDEVDYLVEVLHCWKCGTLWQIVGGVLEKFERIPLLDARRRSAQV